MNSAANQVDLAEDLWPPPSARALRGASLCQTLHWLASGRIAAEGLTQTYLDAIAADNPRLNA